jgi:hypothetical protein
MIPHNFNEAEAHSQYDDALKRRDTWKGERNSIGTIIHAAKEAGYTHADPYDLVEILPASTPNITFDLNSARPVFYPNGMPPREFAGPEIEGGARLLPMDAISLLVALGGVGKTTAIIKMATHIAVGKDWASSEIQQRRVIVFCVEENQEELNRKFGAAIKDWTDAERNMAADNLRLVSCLGMEARLTSFDERQVEGTGIAEKMIEAAVEFDASVIVIDHLQGFVSGDLNLSDTATALSREANKIVSETKAAVLIAAHIAKANINAQGVDHGFTTGSLAFENAARQVIGIIPLSDDDAKKYGLEHVRKDYMRLEVPKNSYGPAGVGSYLAKVHVPDFHTITVEPFAPSLPVSSSMLTKQERLQHMLLGHITTNTGVTRNILDGLAGMDDIFKASKQSIRQALKELEDNVLVRLRNVSNEERKSLGLPRQVRQVYEVIG